MNDERPKWPSLPLYTADFLTDENVVGMTNEEVGIYIKLLCYEWREGSIPDDKERLAHMVSCGKKRFSRIFLKISPLFLKKTDDGGRLVHPRSEKERKKLLEKREVATEKGKKGAKARWERRDGRPAPPENPPETDSPGNATTITQPQTSDGTGITQPMPDDSIAVAVAVSSSITGPTTTTKNSPEDIVPNQDNGGSNLPATQEVQIQTPSISPSKPMEAPKAPTVKHKTFHWLSWFFYLGRMALYGDEYYLPYNKQNLADCKYIVEVLAGGDLSVAMKRLRTMFRKQILQPENDYWNLHPRQFKSAWPKCVGPVLIQWKKATKTEVRQAEFDQEIETLREDLKNAG